MTNATAVYPSEARHLIIEGTAPAGLTVSGSLGLSGCTGLTFGGLQTLQGNLRYLYFASPAPWLATAVKELKIKGLRPVERDRAYRMGVLRLDISGCYDDIYRSVSRIKKQLLERPDLEEWQRVAIRMFR